MRIHLAVVLAFPLATLTWAAEVPPPNGFQVRSYTGKCLDYGAPRPGSGATVYLNDCSAAHAIVVQEINNRHEVILHAGSQVIGIRAPRVFTTGGPPAAPPALYRLELQTYHSFLASTANQVFLLDGDSIILASSRPCINSKIIPATDNPNAYQTADVDPPAVCPPAPPELVVQPQDGRGAIGTPLVAAARNLAEPEFWDFKATDHTGRYPTSGFVDVSSAAQLWDKVCADPQVPVIDGASLAPAGPCKEFAAGWGTVIVVKDGQQQGCVLQSESGPTNIGPCIDLTGFPAVILPPGVTLRGDRRGTLLGPQIGAGEFAPRRGFAPAIHDSQCTKCVFQMHGDYARITGLRLRGPTRTTGSNRIVTDGIQVDPSAVAGTPASVAQYISMIDHNDLSDWADAAINIEGNRAAATVTSCAGVEDDQRTQANALIARNFIHHNENNEGYGMVSSGGGRMAAVGNTFLMNRHAISSDGEAHSEYRAWYNLKQIEVPGYGLLDSAQQDFDVHGTGGTGSSGHYGGIAGYMVDIAGNTFLGVNDFDNYNFELRGHPCSTDYFRDNVTQRSQDANGGGVINFHNVGDPPLPFDFGPPDIPETPVSPAPDPHISQVIDRYNQFGNSAPPYVIPTEHVGAGDFDGDQRDDLFLTTGTAWYYSPGAAAEWRFLSARPDKLDSLLLGDFDGDGRTDVVKISGGYLMVSWGGSSDWEQLNPNPVSGAVTEMYAGRFGAHAAGDHRDDIFWDDETTGTWYVSSGGSGPFIEVNTSSYPFTKLRFGDFNGDGLTDVFSVGIEGWQVSYGATSEWTPLPYTPEATVGNLVVADFDGDGRADVASLDYANTNSGAVQWRYSADGVAPLVPRQNNATAACGGLNSIPAIGHFSGGKGADLLVWSNNEICIAPNGVGDFRKLSRQQMR